MRSIAYLGCRCEKLFGTDWLVQESPRTTQLAHGTPRSHLSFFLRHESQEVCGWRRGRCAACGSLRFIVPQTGRHRTLQMSANAGCPSSELTPYGSTLVKHGLLGLPTDHPRPKGEGRRNLPQIEVSMSGLSADNPWTRPIQCQSYLYLSIFVDVVGASTASANIK